MRKDKFYLIAVLLLLLFVLCPLPGYAGWLFGNDAGSGRSGLDLVQGYDRNTVVTVSGRVTVSPDQAADPVTFELTAGAERFVVVMGPRWYLQDDKLDWKSGEAVSVRGSKAQGRDGRTYLLAQWVKSSTVGILVLRNEAGRPGWSGGLQGTRQGGNGQMPSGGAGGHKGR
jgi:hypothetical protein